MGHAASELDRARECVSRVRELADTVRFDIFGTQFQFIVRPDRAGATVQARFLGECADSGAREYQLTRRWPVSPHATDSEIVQTLFKLCLTAVEHEVREAFQYRGAAIFGPHFDVNVLREIALAGRHDAR